MFDLYTIIAVIIAAVVIFRFLNVLGHKGDDDPPYADWYGGKNDKNGRQPTTGRITEMIPRHKDESDKAEEIASSPAVNWPNLGITDQAVIRALEAIMTADNEFNITQFITGARTAYETVVTSFAKGELDVLEKLLNREVLDRFREVIDQRQKCQQTVDLTFVGISQAKVKAASLSGSDANITIEFTSEIISSVRDGENRIIEGDPNKIANVVDTWTFARAISQEDLNWQLVAT